MLPWKRQLRKTVETKGDNLGQVYRAGNMGFGLVGSALATWERNQYCPVASAFLGSLVCLAAECAKMARGWGSGGKRSI